MLACARSVRADDDCQILLCCFRCLRLTRHNRGAIGCFHALCSVVLVQKPLWPTQLQHQRKIRHYHLFLLNFSQMAIDKLNPAETALVLIEYQNEFTTEGGALYEAVKPCLEKYNTIANSKKAVESARMAGCTIIHVPIAFEDGHKEIAGNPYGILQAIKEGKTFKAGEWGSAFCEEMKPGPTDLICKGKSGLCGFHSTNLDFLLRQNGIKNVVLGGFLTNCCVESTMRTAYEHGYKVFTLKDCCAATSVEGQEAAVEHTFGMFSVPTTSDEIIAAVQG